MAFNIVILLLNNLYLNMASLYFVLTEAAIAGSLFLYGSAISRLQLLGDLFNSVQSEYSDRGLDAPDFHPSIQGIMSLGAHYSVGFFQDARRRIAAFHRARDSGAEQTAREVPGSDAIPSSAAPGFRRRH